MKIHCRKNAILYECAVDEQRAEHRQHKKKLKAQEVQLPQIEPVPMTVEPIEDPSQG